jgi:hypothetical protein
MVLADAPCWQLLLRVSTDAAGVVAAGPSSTQQQTKGLLIAIRLRGAGGVTGQQQNTKDSQQPSITLACDSSSVCTPVVQVSSFAIEPFS